jgi:hypothetical protein
MAAAPHLESTRAPTIEPRVAALEKGTVNNYRAVHISPGQWGVEMFVDGAPCGVVRTGMVSEAEALHEAYVFARTEVRGRQKMIDGAG